MAKLDMLDMTERTPSRAAHPLLTVAFGALAAVGAVAVVNAAKRCITKRKAQLASVGEDCMKFCESMGKTVKEEAADCMEKIRTDLTAPCTDSCTCEDTDSCEDADPCTKKGQM